MISRRRFLQAAGASGLGLAGLGGGAARAVNWALPGVAARTVTPRSPIDTLVIVTMENRSVDHYLGWYGAELSDPANIERTRSAQRHPRRFDGVQHRTYAGEDGIAVPTEAWGAGGREEWAGCGYADPGHGWDSGRVQLGDSDGDGEPDGFLRPGSGNDAYALSYYEPDDIPVTAGLVRRFTTFDRYFCSVMSSTYPNREYLHSGQGIRNNSFPFETGNDDWLLGFDWPCIWDTLDLAGVTWGQYFGNIPPAALWGPRYLHRTRHLANFYTEAALGLLPQVSVVDPYFVAPEGLTCDDHPWADIRLGQQFIADIALALIESPHWERSALIITYDEWGGFFDHVTPPQVDDPRAADGFGQLGFRVPTILVSPYAVEGFVDHGVYDHTSILKFIEWNYGLRPLNTLDANARDAGERNIGKAFRGFRTFDPEVDVDALRYRAPLEALLTGCQSRQVGVSELFRLAEAGVLDDLGLRTDWPFADSFRSGLAR